MKTKINKMDFLVALYITCLALAEIMSMKTIPLLKIFAYQLNVSVGIFVFPILFAINDVITEVKGKARAKQLVYTSLIMVAIIMVYSIFVTWLPESARFRDGEAYNLVFAKAARISLASLVAFIISGLLDVAIFHQIKVKTKGKMLWLRSNLSNFISQLLDTFIFASIAFYSFQDGLSSNFSFILSIVIPYWLLKCFMSVVETPLTYWGVKWLGKK
ncbi:MAG: queuosine precursor transporter [Candidatus Pacebacteria bacterium]|jgi:hypothetical protein|nr:queuosine precursor transporter [Candidatus Paceibacterota bacterium]